MKQSPEQKSIEDNLRPGSFSAEGFLGDDSRSLIDIIRADQATVESLALSHQAIAARLRSLTEQGKASLGRPVLLENRLEITVEDYMGMIPCPFRDHVNCDKRITTCKDRISGQTACWSDLNIHMIEAHGFYEGRGSPFRLDPTVMNTLLFR